MINTQIHTFMDGDQEFYHISVYDDVRKISKEHKIKRHPENPAHWSLIDALCEELLKVEHGQDECQDEELTNKDQIQVLESEKQELLDHIEVDNQLIRDLVADLNETQKEIARICNLNVAD